MAKQREYGQLKAEERELIERLYRQNFSIRRIGEALGRSASTISRELRKHSPYHDAKHYSGKWSHEITRLLNRKSRRQNARKADEILAYVEQKLKLGWTPEQISGRMKIDHPGWSMCHETIYQYIYKDKPWELSHLLPRQHISRKSRSQYRKSRRSMIPNRIPIEQRPEAANNRTELGHWESDSIVSKHNSAAINTKIERKSRMVILTKIANLKPKTTSDAIIQAMEKMPPQALKSFTYDNGIENRDHEVTSQYLNILAYFCNAYHSWEKGSVENANGLIRRFLPKKTDLSKITQEDLGHIESLLNNRPRKCLGYKTPLEAFNQFL